jgi:prophage antirepressor-like protein
MSARLAVQTTRLFYYGEHPVRVMAVSGQVWLRANDVAVALGYKCDLKGAKVSRSIRAHVPERWRKPLVALLGHGCEDAPFDKLEHNKCIEIWITELGAYAIAFGSELPGGDAFAEWVHTEVVPACR